MASHVPRVKGWHVATVIGRQDSSDFVDEWQHDALLLSEPHRRLPSGKWSGGGPFFACHQSVTHGDSLVVPIRVGFGPGAWFVDDRYTAKGCAGVETRYPGSDSLYASAVALQHGELARLTPGYAEGVQKTRPGNPVASGFQFLYELTDFPAIPGSNLWSWFKETRWAGSNPAAAARDYVRYMRSLAGEYLNVAFGWKPFVGDLRKMYKYMRTVNNALAKLREENNKDIHRRVTLENSSDNTQTVTVYPYPYANVLGAPPTYMAGYTVYKVTRRVSTRRWFSAQWHYYVPEIDSWQWEARARLALFGALPTPETIWSVLPWSWAIDWFTNASSLYSNLSVNAVDNATMGYSYTMREHTDVTEVTSHVVHGEGTGFYNWPAVDHTFRSTTKVVTKARVGGGDPYGVEVRFDGLSAYQASIIAALGLSRANFRGFRF
ncbi:maturation protein [ssRNA phage SRR7976357_10]|uniref:Maturation protein n=1 Tax=ssRNA phage SRR7976357_10 TaxID=2786739 RepID=A0A8S5L1K9_9VIRU|nr:maturation protein [ssRNA phage SRR7976357_10]DAD51237.1 TPA_asm: maturation protein [ssRNA phage SRR7976357_10]